MGGRAGGTGGFDHRGVTTDTPDSLIHWICWSKIDYYIQQDSFLNCFEFSATILEHRI